MLAYNPENMTEDEREHLLSTVGQAHAGLSDVALKLRLGLPPKTPALKTAIKAERVAFDLKRSLQWLEVKDVETITRRAALLPEVRRGGKVVDPESLLRHENRHDERLTGLPVEIILVDPVDRIPDPGAHADLVDDHETREFLPVDQDDALRTLGHIVHRGPREPGGGYKHALGRVRRIDRPGEVPKVAFTHGSARSIFLHLIQPEHIFPDRAVDASVTRPRAASPPP